MCPHSLLAVVPQMAPLVPGLQEEPGRQTYRVPAGSLQCQRDYDPWERERGREEDWKEKTREQVCLSHSHTHNLLHHESSQFSCLVYEGRGGRGSRCSLYHSPLQIVGRYPPLSD